MSMIKKFKQLSLNLKLSIVLAIALIIAILLRWDYIKHEAIRSFNFFKHDSDTVKLNSP
ncbi:MAG: hypothetical protein LBE04_01320 [Prevotellaceae bacterium]|jgi:hypothetical protein|nr:hypothetical protein [Prevotellaceae bacterium]